MLSKLHEVKSFRGLLPFVRSAYSRPSVHHWQQEGRQQRQIGQSLGVRSAVQLAIVGAVCRASLSPFSPQCSTRAACDVLQGT